MYYIQPHGTATVGAYALSVGESQSLCSHGKTGHCIVLNYKRESQETGFDL